MEPSIIIKSFKRCSISNALYATEDDILWAEPQTEEEKEELADADFDDQDEDELFYQDAMSVEEAKQLFDTSDDEDFDGF